MKRSHLFFLLFLVPLFSACKVNHLVRTDPVFYTVEDTLGIRPDSAIVQMIAPYKIQLDEEMAEVIGTFATDMERGRPESALWNLVGDALKVKAIEYTGDTIDFAVANSGGLRIPMIAKGPVKKSDIFELLPFDNILVILEMDGEMVLTLVKHMAKSSGWPVSKGLTYQILQSEPQEIKINGTPLDPTKRYKVALPDYIANGGSSAFFLRNIPQQSTGRFMRDAVIEYIQDFKEPIRIPIEGRIEIVN